MKKSLNPTTLFSTQLREIRQERQLSQRDVAEKLHVPISTYANWEQGRREPSIQDIFNLLFAFDIEATDLFDKESYKQ